MAKRYLYISHLERIITAINEERQAVGRPPLSQEEIEKGTGVTRQTVWRWRQTKKPLTSVNEATVDAFMQFFKVSEDMLYTRVEVEQRAASTIYA